MRVISGSARGRRLLTPRGDRIRPTADRVKESLFNILAGLVGNFAGCRVLDVFAGTGNLGIEALSRGAAAAVFIDENREAASLVTRNLELTGFADRGTVLRNEALAALKSLERSAGTFALVFLDPPYRQGLSERVLEFLAGSPLIDDSSLVVAETAAQEELPDGFGRLAQFDRRVYGDTAITFFMLKKQ
ncbi:MAG: 16S rRNA (guanine(966)-N(2))-methyltransferase RsmD [Geobacteraceae bacterium]|nr:16S rRNA (guanine(966)-N(2))-methyltransferase RsmD [Geobacteraceae bacterium]